MMMSLEAWLLLESAMRLQLPTWQGLHGVRCMGCSSSKIPKVIIIDTLISSCQWPSSSGRAPGRWVLIRKLGIAHVLMTHLPLWFISWQAGKIYLPNVLMTCLQLRILS